MKDFGNGMVLILRTMDWFDWFYIGTVVLFGVLAGYVADAIYRYAN